MKEPRHFIKHRVAAKKQSYLLNIAGEKSYWRNFYKDGWLGSDVFDKNAVEICEGDRVQIDDKTEIYTVTFRDGAFWLDDLLLCEAKRLCEFEIVGHIAEEQQ